MSEPARTIGLGRGTAMMLNIVLGAGLLTLPGLAAQVAGDTAPLVWFICALAAIPLLAVFAILGRRHSSSGGIPAWTRQAFGELAYVPATLLFFGAVCVGLPSIAITGGYYAATVFPGDPYALAVLLLICATASNLISPERAGRFNAAVASGLLVTMVMLAAAGWTAVEPEPSTIMFSAFEALDLPSFGLAFMMIFFAFTGWEVAANLGGDFRNPKRDVPLAIAASFIIASALYLVLAFIVAGAGPAAAVEAPFAVIFSERFGASSASVVAFVAVLLIFANLSAAVWAVSRMVMSASREGILPAALGRRTEHVPLPAVIATSLTLLFVTSVSGMGVIDLGGLLAAAGMNFLLLYGCAALALIALSKAFSHRLVAVFALIITVGLVATRPLEALQYPAALVVLGLTIAALQRWQADRRNIGASKTT